jgi:hypothetical protein
VALNVPSIAGNLSGTVGGVGSGGITSGSFGSGAINANSIAANAIGADELADNAIDSGSLANDAITAAKLAANVATEIQTGLLLQSYFDALFDGAPTFAEAMDDHGYTTNRAEKIDRLAPSLLLSTTVEFAASQTSLELDEGPAEDDVFNGSLVIITDASEPAIKAVALIKDYDGDTKTITLVTDPEIFTITAEDSVDVIATGSPAALWLGSSP